jgi:hypothetical protein
MASIGAPHVIQITHAFFLFDSSVLFAPALTVGAVELIVTFARPVVVVP